MGRMLSFERGCFEGQRGYLLLCAHAWLPFFLFQRVCLRRCWVSSFGGIFSPGAIAGNLHSSAVQRRTDFMSSPLGETVLVWLFVALDCCGLSFGLFVGYLSGLLTRYVLPVWVIPCPAPSSFRHAYPRFGRRV